MEGAWRRRLAPRGEEVMVATAAAWHREVATPCKEEATAAASRSGGGDSAQGGSGGGGLPRTRRQRLDTS